MDFNLDVEKLQKLDRTFLPVEDFEDHSICQSLGWDRSMLKGLIDAKLMGGGYCRKLRAYLTSELFLYVASQDRLRAIKRRLALEEWLLE